MDFRVELDYFRGPLDLLLYLVRKHELDVRDLPIALITEQFLTHLEVLEKLDVNEVGDAMCPVGEKPSAQAPRFQVLEGFDDPIIEKYQRLLAANDAEVAGVEFIRDERGVPYTYDINTNTNYNSAAEERSGKSGMRAVAAFLGQELAKLGPTALGQAAE